MVVMVRGFWQFLGWVICGVVLFCVLGQVVFGVGLYCLWVELGCGGLWDRCVYL